MKKLLFVYNARSGKAQIRVHLANIIDTFVKAGYYVEAYPTQREKDAKRQIARQGQYFDLIVVAGGDGTLNEAIAGMMKLGRKIPLGYIPSGSTNDFATSIKLPKDMLLAAQTAVKGAPAYVDVGGFNRRKFIYIAAFGAFTDVSYSTPQDMKNLLGHSAYLIEALKTFGTIMNSHHFLIERNNGQIIEDDFIYGMITNSVSVGGFRGITGKNIVLDDGLFEVMLIKKPKNALELQDIVTCLLTCKSCRNIVAFKASRLKFVSDEKVKWVLDGEFGGSQKTVVIRNYNCAVKVITGFEPTKKQKAVKFFQQPSLHGC
jgi:YegS/Rv2252/BmrU family lipid kinase